MTAPHYSDFDWNNAKAFLATVEAGSLSAAARLLNVSQPTLSRQVSALEQQLGVALFERGSTGLKPTPTGLALVEQVRQMAEAANHLMLSAAGQTDSLTGTVSISATEMTALMVLPPLILTLRQQYPGLTLNIIATNETSNLKHREADIAIRSFRPTEDDLIIRRLPNDAYGLFAAQIYIDGLSKQDPLLASRLIEGTPEQALLNAQALDFIGFKQQDKLMQMLAHQGIHLTTDQFRLMADHSLLNWTLVQQGAGIGLMLKEVGLKVPGMLRVLPHIQMPESERWLVSHRELRSSQRIRVVYDFLAEHLSLADRC